MVIIRIEINTITVVDIETVVEIITIEVITTTEVITIELPDHAQKQEDTGRSLGKLEFIRASC